MSFSWSHDNLAAALAYNDEYRRPDAADGPEGDLWSLEQINAADPAMLPAIRRSCPVLYPGVPSGHVALPAQHGYDAKFDAACPRVRRILETVSNVVVCGGAAGHAMTGGPLPGDVDLFVYGVPADDENALDVKLLEIDLAITSIYASGEDSGVLCCTLVTGLCCYIVQVGGRKMHIQVILRAYQTISSILHGFDVTSCCVAYAGALPSLNGMPSGGCTTLMTWLGGFSQRCRINVVAPAYRSTTYERRLGKYFQRGFALAFPHMAPDALPRCGASPQFVHLPHMQLNVAAVAEVPGASDYSAGSIVIRKSGASDYINDNGTPASSPDARITRRFLDVRLSWDTSRLGKYFTRMLRGAPPMFRSHKTLIQQYGGTPKGGIRELASRDGTKLFLDEALRTCRLAHLPVACRLFELTDAEMIEVCHSGGFNRVLRSAIVERWLNRCYDAGGPCHWWITVDPTRQYTSSLNPRFESPVQWYGGHTSPEYLDAGSHEIAEPIWYRAAIAPGVDMPAIPRAMAFECPICYDAIDDRLPGHSSREVDGAFITTVGNYIQLACGHGGHWDDPSCTGLRGWFNVCRGGKLRCPMCRRKHRILVSVYRSEFKLGRAYMVSRDDLNRDQADGTAGVTEQLA